MIEFLASNWLWIVFIVAMLAMHRHAAVLEVLLIAAGLDLVITGMLGHCPLYQRLGHVPESLRRPS